jgi:hypothetical protein
MRLIALIALDARNWKCVQLNEMKEEVRDISQLRLCSFFSAERIQIPASAPVFI